MCANWDYASCQCASSWWAVNYTFLTLTPACNHNAVLSLHLSVIGSTYTTFSWKVRQYVVNREWRKKRAGRRRNHSRFMSGWLKTGSASAIILLLTSAKKLLTAHENWLEKKIAHKICSQWANLLWAKICSINLLTENQICSRRINFAHGESWIALQSICNLSMDAWHDFYLHTNCSKRRKYAHSNEKLLTKIKFAQSKNLLKAEICSEFARSIEKLPTMKSLASSDGSTGRLNVSHQANRSTTGAHHTTVSVVTAGTCWAGPSCIQGQRTHVLLCFISIRMAAQQHLWCYKWRI